MKRVIFLSLLVAVFVFSGFATSHAAGKVLHIYEAFDTEEAKYYIDAFEKETGIDVVFVRMSSGEVLARVEAEAANPQILFLQREDILGEGLGADHTLFPETMEVDTLRDLGVLSL